MIDKKSMSERDICTKFITPALQTAGWDIQKQIREEFYFTDGRILVKGNMTQRGKRKFADYILYYTPSIPIAIIEAKDNKHSIGAGMQQGWIMPTSLIYPLFTAPMEMVFWNMTELLRAAPSKRKFPWKISPPPKISGNALKLARTLPRI